MRRSVAGFSLMELMVVVAIVGVLAAVAYPSYLNYVRKARRADTQAQLLDWAQALERYYSANATYLNGAALGVSGPTSDFYTYSGNASPAPTANTYTLKSVPKGDQTNDTCGELRIDNMGQKYRNGSTVDNNHTCW